MPSVFTNATQRRIIARRLTVLDGVKAGMSERDIARALNVSRSTVWSDKQALKAEGRI